MLERPSRLRFAKADSVYAWPYRYHTVKPLKVLFMLSTFALIPYASVRTYNRIDRTGYWERRIEEKRVRKMAFDFMLKS